MEKIRPIKSSGSYKINFIHWPNKYEAVIDHISDLARNSNSENNVSYQERPYFDVPLSEVEFMFRDMYDCTSTGLSKTEINRLTRTTGTNRECSICLSIGLDGIKLHCGHVFHAECITKWLRCKVECPNCRRSARNT